MAGQNIKQDTSNNMLWQAYEIIKSYYHNKPTEAARSVVQCMVDLLQQIDPARFTPIQRVGICAAKEYWFHNAQELAPALVWINSQISNKVTYKDPIEDNRATCVTLILSTDGDQLNDFPEFLESICYAGLSQEKTLMTVQKHFTAIPELQKLTA